MLTDSNVRSAAVLENSTTRLSLTNSLTGFTELADEIGTLEARRGFQGRPLTARSQTQSFCGRRPKVAGLRP
ncbi:MAG: hypothetical protein E5Y31_08980 [Mesorhizobium sp.]|nr:MAG: hypothetical protein E5Y31_08980 [Mesorhizobium sp.]